MKSSIKIEGLSQLQRALRQLPAEMQDKPLAAAARAGAAPIAETARSLAPVLAVPHPGRKAGTLRDAIKVSSGRGGPVATVYVYVRTLTAKAVARFKRKRGNPGAVNPDDPFYWRFLEFGTSKMAARPFMRPAFEAQKMAAVERIAAVLRSGIDRAAKKLGWGQL